jgi:hypothetical protein
MPQRCGEHAELTLSLSLRAMPLLPYREIIFSSAFALLPAVPTVRLSQLDAARHTSGPRMACPVLGPHATRRQVRVVMSAVGGILLQKSKIAGPGIFRENTKRKAITDSYNLNRVVEVACEFDVTR